MKRILSLLLTALMLVSALPFTAFADEPEVREPGKELLPVMDEVAEELNQKLEEDKASTGKGEAADEEYPWGGLSDEAFKAYVFAPENAEYLKKLVKKTGSTENKAFRARIRLIEKNADRKEVQAMLEKLAYGGEAEEEPEEEELSAEERVLLDKTVKKSVQEEDEETDPARERAAALADEFAGKAEKDLAAADEDGRAVDAAAIAALMAGAANVRSEMSRKGIQSKTLSSLPENGKTLASSELYEYGYCGPDAMWGFTLDGILVVTGTGRMYNYDNGSYKAPWAKYADYICAIGVSGVTNVGDYSFYDCEETYLVLIEEGVMSIGVLSFAGLFSLPEINIPASVTSIASGAFAFTVGLTSVTVASGNAYYMSQGNCVIKRSNYEVAFGCKTSEIPSGVKSIGDSAFAGCPLTACTIPDGVTTIGTMAFYGADQLTSITIPGSVTSIGDSAFYGCDSLRDVYFKGTQAKWDNIYIDSWNTELLSARLHCEAGPTTQVSVTLSKTKANITWKAVTGATGYKLYMRLDNESKPSKMVTITKAKTVKYSYSGLVPGHTYHFSVAPVISGTTGERSAEASVTVYLDTPKLKAKRVGGQMSLSWSAVKGASGYELTVTDSAGNTETYKYGAKTKKATIQGKRSGRHTLTLTAYTSSAVSKPAVVSLDVALDTPKLKAKAKGNVITVSWSAVKGTAGYKLTVTDSAGNSNTQTLGAAVKKATLTVAPSGTYTISLYACSGDMTSKTATVRGTVTLTATALKAKASKGTVALSWKQVKTASAYEIWRAEGSSGEFRCIATVGGSVKKYTDTKVTVGSSYAYKVRPMGSGTYAYGKGPVTGPFSAAVRVTAK